MPLHTTHQDAQNSNHMFDEHLAEIALDWVRAPAAAAPGGRAWGPAAGFITLLAESQAELIDLTGALQPPAAAAIDLTIEPALLPQAA